MSETANNGSCCHATAGNDTPPATTTAVTNSCCPSDTQKTDYLLWVCGSLVVAFYSLTLLHNNDLLTIDLPWLTSLRETVFELVNRMWWGIVIAILFVGLLGRIPRELVMAALGKGVVRATGAGLLLDLCSHGILLVGMRLYERGASLGQVMAFLIASPWNSLSLTLIMISLIGLQWTLAFIVLSAVIAIISGKIFEYLVDHQYLPDNPNTQDLPEDFRFWPETKALLKNADYSGSAMGNLIVDGIKGSRMVLRWLLLGILLAAGLRTFLSPESFATWFGPSMMGLVATLGLATVLEICSEGSTPIAADLMSRAGAPGNSFTFLMAGVSTDYTEIMSLKDTTDSWKIALFLPLVTLPQILLLGWLLNQAV